MTASVVCLNGVRVESVSPWDRGNMFGDGVFETLLAVDGRLPTVELHLARLAASSLELGLVADAAELVEALRREVGLALTQYTEAAGSVGFAYVRVAVTAGDYTASEASASRLVMIRSYERPPAVFYDAGIHMVSLVGFGTSPLARHKTLSYMPHMFALRAARLRGADDGLLLDDEETILEGITSNVFWVRNGHLFTPSLTLPILPGVTRARVIELAQQASIGVAEVSETFDVLDSVDELFTTSSLRGVVPVVTLDDEPVGTGKPGPVYQQLAALYAG